MTRMRVTFTLVVCAALLALAAPAAYAERPSAGSFFNGTRDNGGFMINSKTRIKELWLYCDGARYAVRELIRIRRDGTFRLRRGSAERFGNGGSPRGIRRVSLRGRFTSNDSVRITRRLEQCGRGTVVLTRER